MKYSAPSAKNLASDIASKLSLNVDHERGLDHAAWVPLLAMYPSEDIPVLTLFVSPSKGCECAYKLGQTLRYLRNESVLIVGCGGVVHNLATLNWANVYGPTVDWAMDVFKVVDNCLKTGKVDNLLKPETLLNSEIAFPSLEHYLPFIVSLGAAGGERAVPFFEGWRYGSLSMHSYQFG